MVLEGDKNQIEMKKIIENWLKTNTTGGLTPSHKGDKITNYTSSMHYYIQQADRRHYTLTNIFLGFMIFIIFFVFLSFIIFLVIFRDYNSFFGVSSKILYPWTQ